VQLHLLWLSFLREKTNEEMDKKPPEYTPIIMRKILQDDCFEQKAL